jgi:hypothetical protein
MGWIAYIADVLKSNKDALTVILSNRPLAFCFEAVARQNQSIRRG